MDRDVGQAIIHQGFALAGIHAQPPRGLQQARTEPEEELAQRPLVLAPERRDQRPIAHAGLPPRHRSPSRTLLVHATISSPARRPALLP